MDVREDLFEKIMMVLISNGVNNDAVKTDLRILLDQYEISMRTTEIAVPDDDRNASLVKRFLTAKMVSGRSAQTVKYYKYILQFVLSTVGKSVDDITADDIRLYLAIRQKRDGISKTTAGNELRVLRSFYQYLTTEELVERNPTAKIDAIKIGKRDEIAFTDLEVEKIRNSLITGREKCLIEMLLSTGCRISEIAQIRVGEIKNEKVIVHGKGAKDRTVYLNAKAMLALQNYMNERNDNNPYVFCNSSEAFRKQKHDAEWYRKEQFVGNSFSDRNSLGHLVRQIGERAGVENVHAHRFRRTCATLALRRGMPLEQVSKMLGHEQLDTTKIYLSITDDEVEEAHRKYVT